MIYKPSFLKKPKFWKRRKAYDRAYYELNLEKILAYKRAYHQKRKAEIQAKALGLS
jgi:hypothetical protein